ncbi:MAG: Rid family detoxifying hydrolase [Candidatus Eremiobacteraeota bacterium]|nr:Rid family detoxifying hydrolase [Candidatus Eremiobacteraeota bacterium]
MEIHAVATDSAPDALGPYSQAIRCGDMVYVSGQLPVVRATGKLIDGGIREQTLQLFENLRAILEAAGSSLANVVKVTVFIAEWSDFAAFNVAYSELFEAPFPARSTIQNSRPMNALVGADVIGAIRKP